MDRVIDYFAEQGRTIVLLENELESTDISSKLKFRSGKQEQTIREYFVFPKTPPLRWLGEVFMNLSLSLQKIKVQHYYIAVDPLNFITAYFLKKFQRRGILYFHAIDYSENRFSNSLLNSLYLKLFLFALKKADRVTAVSQRMIEKFNALHSSNKYLYLPNSPAIEGIPFYPTEERKHFTLVLSSILHEGLNYDEIVWAVDQLSRRLGKAFKLEIVGDGPGRKKIAHLITGKPVEQHIHFHGMLSYEDSLQVMAQASIGITDYIGEHSWIYYGDSLKIREYAACGLPIVTNGTTGTALEAQEHGCADVFHDKKGFVSSVEKLLTNSQYYKMRSINSRIWAKKYDKASLLPKCYPELFASN